MPVHEDRRPRATGPPRGDRLAVAQEGDVTRSPEIIEDRAARLGRARALGDHRSARLELCDDRLETAPRPAHGRTVIAHRDDLPVAPLLHRFSEPPGGQPFRRPRLYTPV